MSRVARGSRPIAFSGLSGANDRLITPLSPLNAIQGRPGEPGGSSW